MELIGWWWWWCKVQWTSIRKNVFAARIDTNSTCNNETGEMFSLQVLILNPISIIQQLLRFKNLQRMVFQKKWFIACYPQPVCDRLYQQAHSSVGAGNLWLQSLNCWGWLFTRENSFAEEVRLGRQHSNKIIIWIISVTLTWTKKFHYYSNA